MNSEPHTLPGRRKGAGAGVRENRECIRQVPPSDLLAVRVPVSDLQIRAAGRHPSAASNHANEQGVPWDHQRAVRQSHCI